jgi:hypothetical protein
MGDGRWERGGERGEGRGERGHHIPVSLLDKVRYDTPF